MELDVDFLITFFKKYTITTVSGDIDEQDAAASSGGGATSSSSSSSSSVPKWADVVGGPKRAHANMLGKSGEKWSSGLNRGVANQIW